MRMLVLGCGLACGSALAQAPDLVLVNGRIATLDAKGTVAEAIAIRGERIVAVGNFARVKAADREEHARGSTSRAAPSSRA